MQQIVGSEELSVILLTDEARKRVLTVVCDAEMTRQLLLRLRGNVSVTRTMLPEALLQLLPSKYEMMIVGVYDGQYQVMLMDIENGNSVRVRTSDAVLLSIISHIPIYIEERLMERQSIPYDENATGVAIPINSMDTPRLKAALENAVEEENYELASQLRDEIKRRKS
jgi:bifunctional DNase/RNase